MSVHWDVIVLGAGPGGLAAGRKLAMSGLRTLILEGGPEAGGLCRGDDLEGAWTERIYHGIVPQDRALLDLAGELGLQAPAFRNLPLGFLLHGHWRRSSRLPLGLASLFRGRSEALSLLSPKAPSGWDQRAALPWIEETFGRRGQELLVPLLRKKFGAWADEFSLLAFYGRIARERSGLSLLGGSQRLAAFEGGLRTLTEGLVNSCRKAGAEIRLAATVSRLEPGAGLWTVSADFNSRLEALGSRRVLSTLPLPRTLDLLPPELSRDAPWRRVRHLDAGIVRVLARKSVSPFYFCALPSDSSPFVALVEGTRLRPHPRGFSVLYLARYAPEGTLEPVEILKEKALRLLSGLPSPLRQEDILRLEAWTASAVQPLFDRGYLGLIPRHRSPWSGLYVSDASQIFPGDRGVSATISQAGRVAERIVADSIPSGGN